jgi:hypothetical protein
MPFEKGHKLATGRPAGVPNQSTDMVRKSLAAIIEGNIPDIHSALAEVRNQNPARYLDLYIKLLEFSTPKLMSIKSNVELGEGTIQSIQVIMKGKNDTEDTTPIEIT